jgi:hypothetical protein
MSIINNKAALRNMELQFGSALLVLEDRPPVGPIPERAREGALLFIDKAIAQLSTATTTPRMYEIVSFALDLAKRELEILLKLDGFTNDVIELSFVINALDENLCIAWEDAVAKARADAKFFAEALQLAKDAAKTLIEVRGLVLEKMELLGVRSKPTGENILLSAAPAITAAFLAAALAEAMAKTATTTTTTTCVNSASNVSSFFSNTPYMPYVHSAPAPLSPASVADTLSNYSPLFLLCLALIVFEVFNHLQGKEQAERSLKELKESVSINNSNTTGQTNTLASIKSPSEKADLAQEAKENITVTKEGKQLVSPLDGLDFVDSFIAQPGALDNAFSRYIYFFVVGVVGISGLAFFSYVLKNSASRWLVRGIIRASRYINFSRRERAIFISMVILIIPLLVQSIFFGFFCYFLVKSPIFSSFIKLLFK